MSGKIEKQGKRIGYIIGGIFALILGAFLTMLYVPTLLSMLFGIDPIWDMTETFVNVFGANIMEMILVWGTTTVLAIFVGVYFVCLFARPSTNSTMFRLSALAGALGLLVPALFSSLALMSEGEIDLLEIGSYVLFAMFIISFILYVVGIVARIKQKFHKNRSSTVLVFSATFWMLLILFPALSVLNSIMNANVTFFDEASAIVLGNPLGLIAIFAIVSAIWMLITYKHRVVVDYNPDTRNRNAKGRPEVMMGDGGMPSTMTLEDLEHDNVAQAQAPASPRAMPQEQARFSHNYTQQTAPQSFSSGFSEQPYNPQPQQPRPIVSQPAPVQNFNQQNAFNAPQNGFNQAPRPATPTFAQSPVTPAQTPSFTAPRPNPLNANPQNPYASFNNFTQNNPYNRPAPQAPVQPRPTPIMPQQNAFPQQPQAPRPAPMPAQAQRPMNPAQAPRPASNPFVTPNGAQNPAQRPPVSPYGNPVNPTAPRPVNPNNPNNPNGNGGF